MWKNAGITQQNCLELSKKINSVVSQIEKLDAEQKKIFIKQNIQELLTYAKTTLQVMQAFQMEEAQKEMQYMDYLCNDIEEGKNINGEQFVYFFQMIKDIDAITKQIIENHKEEQKICSCCEQKVYYWPISQYYKEQEKKYRVIPHEPETLNEKEYTCPVCGASDRDRLLISMLKRLGIQQGGNRESLLQIAPAQAIDHWIHRNCLSLQYDTTDLFMENVTFNSDIQDMNMVLDESYDYIICSHVLEHVQDDKKAMKELYRILKKDGFGMFLVPIALDMKKIDEEWGLSDEENWKRFGQNDHCRRYSKDGFVRRLKDAGFCVHQLGKDFFGENSYKNNGLTETSILYVVTKKTGNIEEIIREKRTQQSRETENSPLVSVLMSAYNHEKYVAKTVDSVLNQTYKNIEFLVADDCSSDNTCSELLKYEKEIDEIHLFDENAYGRLNFLSLIAKGKYIAIINSDDVWEKDKIKKQVCYMENHPEIVACFTGAQCIDENDNPMDFDLFLNQNMKKESWMRQFYMYGNCLAHPSVLIRKEVYQELQNSGISMFRQLPDYWMWVKLVQNNEIHVIEQDLLKFRMHESGNDANTSARTEENGIRHCNEERYLWYDTFKNMDNDYFKKVFSKQLVYPNANSNEEILCEKFFVLKNSNKVYLRQAALFFLYDICKNEKVVSVLKEQYKFKYADIYEMSGKAM